MSQFEFPDIQVGYQRFDSLSVEEWRNLWNTLRKRPQKLAAEERDFLLTLFCEVHFSVRPYCDLEICTVEKRIPKCTGWIGLALWFTSHTSNPTDKLELNEMIRQFEKRQNMIGTLLFGTRDHYLKIMTSVDDTPIPFEMTKQQNQFLQQIVTDLISCDARGMLRKRMDEFQQQLAEQSVLVMKQHHEQLLVVAQNSTQAYTTGALLKRKGPCLSRTNKTNRQLVSSVPIQVMVCFLATISGFELLKLALGPSGDLLTSDVSALIVPILFWAENIAIENFIALGIASLILFSMQKEYLPYENLAELFQKP